MASFPNPLILTRKGVRHKVGSIEVTVRLSHRYRLEMRLGMLLLRAGAWLTGVGYEEKRDDG